MSNNDLKKFIEKNKPILESISKKFSEYGIYHIIAFDFDCLTRNGFYSNGIMIGYGDYTNKDHPICQCLELFKSLEDSDSSYSTISKNNIEKIKLMKDKLKYISLIDDEFKR